MGEGASDSLRNALRCIRKTVDWDAPFTDKTRERSRLIRDRAGSKYGRTAHLPLSLENNVIGKQAGIYAYMMDGDEQHLNLRAFDTQQKNTAYERQKGICKICRKKFEFREMEGDHITPWIDGGLTDSKNLQMLCKECNRGRGPVDKGGRGRIRTRQDRRHPFWTAVPDSAGRAHGSSHGPPGRLRPPVPRNSRVGKQLVKNARHQSEDRSGMPDLSIRPTSAEAVAHFPGMAPYQRDSVGVGRRLSFGNRQGES